MAKRAAANEILLNTVRMLSDTADPTAGGGVARIIGSLYLRAATAGLYLKTGAAATAWTALSQSFNWFNPRDYGAAGDGVTDDRPAIAAAIAAAVANGGGCVYFPRGTYLCSKDGANPYCFDLNGVSDLTFQGAGPESILRQSGNAASGPFSLIRVRGNCNRLRFQDLTFDGTGVTNPAVTDHLLEIGTGTGSPSNIQIFRCLFQNMVTGAGDCIHVLGASGNLVSQLWVLDSVFQTGARYGVGVEQGLQRFWICENAFTGLTTDIAFVSTANAVVDEGVIVGNEIVHTGTDRRALRLIGDNTGLITNLVCNDNMIVDGFVEISNVDTATFATNVQTSGVFASADPSWRMTRTINHVVVSGNIMVRETGSTAGPVFSLESAGGVEPTLTRVGNNILINEVTAGAGIFLLDVLNVSVGSNLFRSSNAGASSIDAIDVQAVGSDVSGLQLIDNNISASTGTFRSAVRLLVNGANITNVQINENQATQIAHFIRHEDAGVGSFNGILMEAGNNPFPTTGLYSEVGTTVAPYIGLNAAAVGPVYRCGNGTPEGAISAAVGSLFSQLDGGQDSTLYYKQSGTGNTGWVAVGGAVIAFGINSAGTAATALFAAPGFSSATAGATELQWACPRPGILRNLRIRANAAGTDAATVTYTVRVNGVNTALAAGLANDAAGNASDTVDAVVVAAGDLVSVQITKSGVVTAGHGPVNISLELA